MLNLLVSVRVQADKREKFLAAITENAESSVRDEPGCYQFDVFEDDNEDNHFFYYERYTDRAAFEAHKASTHFAAWREVAEDVLVPGSQLNTFGTSVTTVIETASV
ncbi:putative quinol monooxygenase [Rhodococcoides kyotonense]|uniref:Quinol monooxygenase YgiN n=1 Tax=Rhodococcoides kyotonense TaxID=398843 RepID=A0A239MZJ5_9NOCA|nr:putative quinol monooxygenase [Rhodococcus kyotonensis]SNT47368.1 Quinol monooxygenase YgiN [Rhodococcus kyotonensis]